MDTSRIHDLYAAIAKASAERPPTTRELPRAERQAYLRELKRRSRAKAKEAAESGRLEARADVVRDILADAALILLASGAPGADAIERLLGIAFQGRPGVPGTVRAKARAGAIKPKLLTPEVLRQHAALAILDRAPDVAPDPGDEIIG